MSNIIPWPFSPKKEPENAPGGVFAGWELVSMDDELLTVLQGSKLLVQAGDRFVDIWAGNYGNVPVALVSLDGNTYIRARGVSDRNREANTKALKDKIKFKPKPDNDPEGSAA